MLVMLSDPAAEIVLFDFLLVSSGEEFTLDVDDGAFVIRRPVAFVGSFDYWLGKLYLFERL